MSPGKAASQAGHAFVGTLLNSDTPESIRYKQLSPGTKVCLRGNLDQILNLHQYALTLGIPSCLIYDSGCPNFFEGKPTITALGIGPGTRDQLKPVVGKLKLY